MSQKEPNFWIEGAIKKPGSLRATAKREGLIKGNQKLSQKDLNELAAKGGPKTRKRVALAKTLNKMNKKRG